MFGCRQISSRDFQHESSRKLGQFLKETLNTREVSMSVSMNNALDASLAQKKMMKNIITQTVIPTSCHRVVDFTHGRHVINPGLLFYLFIWSFSVRC